MKDKDASIMTTKHRLNCIRPGVLELPQSTVHEGKAVGVKHGYECTSTFIYKLAKLAFECEV